MKSSVVKEQAAAPSPSSVTTGSEVVGMQDAHAEWRDDAWRNYGKGKASNTGKAKDLGVPLVVDGALNRTGRVANGVARAGISRGIVGKLNDRRKP